MLMGRTGSEWRDEADMSWRDLRPPDDRWELERPDVSESVIGGHPSVNAVFADDLSREWFAEWMRSKRGWAAFTAWVDEKR
jgi:hypothetical protein